MSVTRQANALARRGAWLIVVLALLAVLALSACGRGGVGRQGGGQGSTGGTGQTTQQTSSAAVNDLIQADAGMDVLMSAMDSASLDANLDESSKDNPMQP
jgi:hypothetical protein